VEAVKLATPAPTRWFHWINALAVLGLIIVGAILLNDDALGISASGKILVKEIHVVLGYVMGLNLIWRFVWAFFGNRYARWTAILPYGTGFWGKLRGYGNAFQNCLTAASLARNCWMLWRNSISFRAARSLGGISLKSIISFIVPAFLFALVRPFDQCPPMTWKARRFNG
jgi:Ni,Fe-hydrogenase I cytochrome b subunit